ncbi:MAG: hypothetical protein HY534_05010 [Chloroflexi bacterium]|nr:hypothetical protein [Chloroflexota bacterium]
MRSDASRDHVLVRLLDLAYDVSSRLRHHAQPVVRLSAALLLAASVAACSGAPVEIGSDRAPVTQAQALAGEVRTGLPSQPGAYQLVPGSLNRDAQGTYQFAWKGPAGEEMRAAASRLQLAQSDTEQLVVPEQGDPVLHLTRDTPIPLVQSDASGVPNQTSGGGTAFVPAFWYPFYGPLFSGPRYYDPPRTVPSGSRVEGGTQSTIPRPLSERTIGLDRAVSGRAGGTGQGSAATLKSGATVAGKSGAASAVGAAPKSGSFSAGKGSLGGIGLSGG